MSDFWFSYLYQPLLNALVWIYNNLANQNMGWAVIILTVFLRAALLPLSIISQRDAMRQRQVELEAKKAVEMFKNDRVAKNEEYRKIMKKNRISPWAKVLVLGIQALVLVLLYQVFISGIFGERLVKVLYDSISFPGAINNDFYGHNIGLKHDVLWGAIVAVYLFVFIIIQKIADKSWEKSEAIFLVLFPLFVFVALWILPMAKSLFILTSMIFSDILTFTRIVLFPTPKEPESTIIKP
ncbi:MAG: YidC/Oxa1 family membrane protein insertase [Candidatus Magasanikbacteria bacterium]|nr:YidC/Oxa1 family membrane protein insertase [Candidatus Magasanikbacteria bacterium]